MTDEEIVKTLSPRKLAIWNGTSGLSEAKAEEYRRRWRGEKPKAAVIPLVVLPRCEHLGAATGVTVGCRTCQQQQLDVYACSKFGRATIGKGATSDAIQCCKWCDFNPDVIEAKAKRKEKANGTGLLLGDGLLRPEELNAEHRGRVHNDRPGDVRTSGIANRTPDTSETRRISVALPGHFNAGLIEFKGKKYLATRFQERIHVHLLTDDYRFFIKPRKPLDLIHPACANGQEDPRLFVLRGKLHVWFAGVESLRPGKISAVTHATARVNQLYAELDDSFQVVKIYAPRYAKRTHWEKNWSPFVVGDVLYVEYGFSPHVVLRIEGEEVTEEHVTTNLLPWSGGYLRGGAPPVMQDNGRFLSFFHGNLIEQGREKRFTYSLGAVEFDGVPPFQVTRQTPEPLLWASERDSIPSRPVVEVIFPAGAIRDGENWVISQGTRDEAVEIVVMPVCDVEAALSPPESIPTELAEVLPKVLMLPGWCSPGKTEELIRLVLKENPIDCVEVGVFGGRSLMPVALALKHLGRGTIHAIDPWDNAAPCEGTQKDYDRDWWSKWPASKIRSDFLKGIETLGVQDQVRVIQATSQAAAKMFGPSSLDYVMIDGNHSPEVSTADAKAWWPKLRPGGWMIFDDWEYASTKAATAWLASQCNEWETKLFLNEDGLGGITGMFRKPG